MVDIRDATTSDIPEITKIYNDAVLNTTAIWNESVVDEANRLAWLNDRTRAGYPALVAIDDSGEVIGYASFGDWRAWEGYRYSIEHSVYIRNDYHRKGVGASIMRALIHRARNCGKHVMIAAIEAENIASIRMHEKLGFEKAGHLKQVGVKFGRWLDLTFLQLVLDSDSPVSR
ncbi:N-acetyltransferase [Acetobacter sacchari]|uniref:N-acetyltransferase n=1 Tax=Acetobacter sacchari TaxID=2661687 RepID=A0ABS3LYQ4_9PROT|nr:GNAT family N-acetyltransferase [Acetobacter sacchari]MBO1361023.1 N-acetyltransferase [Acetobacter sacchari]